MKNPILEEVRTARESLAADFDFDLHRIFADAMKRQQVPKSGGAVAATKEAAALSRTTRAKSK